MFNPAFNDLRSTMDQFRRSVDQLFDNFSGTPSERPGSGERGWIFSPAVETAWSDHNLYLRAVVPGVKQDDVKVTLQGNQLVIEGERKAPEHWNRDAWTQLTYGKFTTAVTLPNGLDTERLNCRLHEGVLDIEIPVSEARKPKQIQVQTGDNAASQKAIAG